MNVDTKIYARNCFKSLMFCLPMILPKLLTLTTTNHCFHPSAFLFRRRYLYFSPRPCTAHRSCNMAYAISSYWSFHDDVIKWKYFPRNWPFVRWIPRSAVNSPHKGQWRGALMFFFICARINGWVNNCEAGDLRRLRPHYNITVIFVRFVPVFGAYMLW